MSIGEYFIEPQEPPFKIIPGPLCYLRVSSSLVGHFSQHSESLCAFASKGCLMIIIIFCRHDSILTQGGGTNNRGPQTMMKSAKQYHVGSTGSFAYAMSVDGGEPAVNVATR